MRLRKEVAARAKRADELGRTYKPSAKRLIRGVRQPRDKQGRFASSGGVQKAAQMNVSSASTRSKTGEARFTNDLNLSRKPYRHERSMTASPVTPDLRDVADFSRRLVERRQSGVRAAVQKTVAPKKSRRRKLNKAGHSVGKPWPKSKASKKPGKVVKRKPEEEIPF